MTDMPVTLQPEMLDWILKKAQSASADSAAVALLAKWQSGEQEPTFHQVQDVSRKTHIPFGYFFLDKPPAAHGFMPECATKERELWVVVIRNEDADETLLYQFEGTAQEAARALMNCILEDQDGDEGFLDGTARMDDLFWRPDGGFEGWNRFENNDLQYTIAPVNRLRPVMS